MTPDLSVYLVTDTAQCGARGVVRTVSEAVAGGATCVQVRDKESPAATLLALTLEVTAAVGDRVPVLVNDRVDVFLAARERGAAVAGVHVGQEDLPVADVRRLVGPDAVVGLSAYRREELDTVAALPPGTADYLGLGPLAATRTKPHHPAPLGVDGVAELRRHTDLPCVAIGGITADDVTPVRAAGVDGVAVVSAICTAPDPRSAAAALRREWDR